MVRVIGVDVAEQRKGLDLVGLDDQRRIVERRTRATVEDVRTMVTALRPQAVCIDSPPSWSLNGNSRAAERELRVLGITAFLTPTDPGDHPFYRWMRAGFAIFDAVADAYPRYRSGPVLQTAMEVFPEATAVVLAGERRPRAESKVVFRRRVLAAHGVDAGALPSLDAVDAALAALTGLIALDGHFVGVGAPEEGVVVLPTSTLPSTPFRIATPLPARPRPMEPGATSLATFETHSR